jgi:hypothetical protein
VRFHICLNLPGRNGSSTQFVICDHDAASVEEFAELLNETDHIVVDALDTHYGELVPGSEMSLNQSVIAKVTPYDSARWGRA